MLAVYAVQSQHPRKPLAELRSTLTHAMRAGQFCKMSPGSIWLQKDQHLLEWAALLGRTMTMR